jgi:hypothetical protein
MFPAPFCFVRAKRIEESAPVFEQDRAQKARVTTID